MIPAIPPKPNIYWVEAPEIGRLGVISRPRSQSCLAHLRDGGVDVVVSMLEPDEAIDAGLDLEGEWCRLAGIEFHARPIVDHGIPETMDEIAAVTRVLLPRLAAGRSVAAHCYAGLGRSPLMIASLLIDGGLEVADACARISRARGTRIPEMTGQLAWLEAYARRPRRVTP